MRVKVTSGETDYWLADLGCEAASNVRLNHRRLTQVGQFLRATNARGYNRGNAYHTISFDVTREHATYNAAVVFLLEHPSSIPGSGRAAFIELRSDGAEIVRYIHNATIDAFSGSVIGVTTMFSYTISGGAFTDEPAE